MTSGKKEQAAPAAQSQRAERAWDTSSLPGRERADEVEEVGQSGGWAGLRGQYSLFSLQYH